jgi:hypothetical protein
MMMKSVLVALVLSASTVVAQQNPRVYIDATDTVDASNSQHKGKQVDFGSALSAALTKKEVPVVVVTDQSKAQWLVKSASSQKEDGTGTKIAKLALFGSSNFTQFEGTIQVVDINSSAVLYAYNVKKGNFQSAAEAFAKHFKSDYLEKRK